MWVIAHRGGGDLYPENTVKAFYESWKLGVDMVECDVHASRDGELMVIHDPNLVRTGGQDRQVKDLSASELQSINVGQGQGVPRLSEVLDAISIPVVVEIKAMEAVQALARLLRLRPELVSRVIPISFYHEAVKELVEQIPHLQGGVLLAGVPVNLAAVAQAARVPLLSLQYETVIPELVEAMHRQNLMVSVWTPNTQSAIQSMIDAKVDGIASDRPDLVLKLLGRTS